MTGRPRGRPQPDGEAGRTPRLMIRASAGTGKTYQLSTRYIAQLVATTPDRILATTFTRKAAGEILERILLRLADAAVDDASRRLLAKALGQPRLSRDQCLSLLTGLVRNLHRVRVSTLDSFFARVAGSFALELGLPAGWRLLDELEADQLRQQAVEAVLREGDRHDLVQLMHLLSKGDSQRSVTGLVQRTVDELYAIFLETPAEAWRPIEGPRPLSADALARAIDDLRSAPLPADKNWSNARAADVAAAVDQDWEALIGKGIAKAVLDESDMYRSKPISAELRRVYRRILQHAAAIECQALSGQLAAAHDLLTRFDAAYHRLKHEAGGLTFDDVAHRLAREFSQQHPAGLAFRLDAHVEHLLLDEFQDTSLVQWTVLEPLARSVAETSGSTFFCVGDVKQAIYGWRGGVAEIFDTVSTRLADVAEQQLDTSFRSSAPVIETVNRVFARRDAFPLLKDHEQAFLQWVQAFPPHATHRGDAPGYACLIAGPEPAPGQTSKEAVYAGAAAFLKELLPQLPLQSSVGVLARTNDAVARIVHELRVQGLPASQEGGNPLTDSAAVQLILSAMQLADHPGDTIARFHVAQSPLGPALDLPRNPTDDHALAAADDIRRSLQTRGYGALVAEWTDVLTPRCNQRELDRLRQLAVLADEFDGRATLRPSEFARFVAARGVEDPRTARIRVMTVHKAKGLEFDVVMLPQLDDQLVRPPKFVACREPGALAAVRVCRHRNKSVQRLLPAEIREAFRQTDDRAVREALCVFYVALTRAAQALYMFVAPTAKPAQTYAGILRHALAAPDVRCEPGAVLYECGDAHWHRRLSPPEAAPAAQAAPAPTRFAPPGGARRRGRESQAPSRLTGGRTLSIDDLLRAADNRALDRGRLLHAWFENLQWLDAAPPTDADLHRVAARLGVSGPLVAESIAEFRGLLESPGIRELLRRETYRQSLGRLFPRDECGDIDEITVENERRFDVPLDEELVSGSIDRLVLLSRNGQVVAADILDFKSDAVYGDRAAAVAQLVEHYSGQLDCYARAVGLIYGLPRSVITTRLVLLATQEIVLVEK